MMSLGTLQIRERSDGRFSWSFEAFVNDERQLVFGIAPSWHAALEEGTARQAAIKGETHENQS